LSRFLTFFQKNASWLVWIATAAIIAIPLFAHLDELPIMTWDELRNAQNALEMNRTGHKIVTYISNHPDTWNTKPPLLTWILAFTQQVFGYNELSIRIPSAVFAALTCFYLLGLVKRHTGRWAPALLAVIILVTTDGYVINHGTRTGDYDSLLTLFTLLAAGTFFDFLRTRRPVQLFCCFLAFTGAVMTKGIAGLFLAPAVLIIAIQAKMLGKMLRSPAFWAGLGIFLLIVGGYYLRRNQLQPGYLQLVWENEIGGRYGDAAEKHTGDFWYYWRRLAEGGFSFWYLLLLPAVFAAVSSREIEWRRLGLRSVICMLCLMLILSTSGTKLSWYLIPAYPFMALLCGMVLDQLCRLLEAWPWAKTFWRWNFLPATLLLMLTVPAYFAMANKSLEPKDPDTNIGVTEAGVYLKEILSGKWELKTNAICGDDYPLLWYRDVFAMKGRQLPVVDSSNLKPGMQVMLWDDRYRNSVKAHYHWSPIDQFRNVEVIRIDSLRSDTLTQGR
jgi:4-amino-4-deoxy-L-arabinose transferase-like glycosyltransferase